MSVTNRSSKMYGLMNEMYHLEQDKPLSQRFIRLEGKVRQQSQLQLDQQLEKTLETQIEINSWWAWGMLLLSVLLVASIPCWVMSGNGRMQFFTKNGWRFLVIAGYLIPFLMFEQRTAKNQTQKLSYFLTVQKLKPVFMSTIHFSIWFGLLIYACKFTSMNHALCLSSLKVFFVVLIKMKKGQKVHEFQIAGCLLTFIGMILVCTDSITLPIIIDHQTRRYLRTQPWKRFVLGDGCAILASISSVYLDQNMKVPGMPRFTYMFFYNLFNAFNLITFGYFFGGTVFSFDPKYGIFGMFTHQNFVHMFYVGTILGFFIMMSHILVAQIFNELVINIATSMKTIVSSLVMQALGLQLIMSGLTPIGYCFVIPGVIFIMGGQFALSNKQNKLSFQLYKAPDVFCPKLLGEDNKRQNSMVLEKQKSFLDKSRQYIVNIKKHPEDQPGKKKQ